MSPSQSDKLPSDPGPLPVDRDELPEDAVFHPVSRRAAAIWSLVFFYPSLALILVRNIALVPLYIKYIGKSEFDLWLVTGAVLMQLTNLDFGLTGVLSQQVAAAYGSRNRAQLQKLIGTGLVLAGVVSLFMASVTAAIAPFLPLLFDVPVEIGHRLTICFLIVAIANAFQLFGFSTGGLLRSLQRSFLYGIFVLISEITSLVATIYLLRAGWGLYSIGMGLAIRAGVEACGTTCTFLWISLWRLKLRPQWHGPQVRQLWKFSIYQFLTQVTGRIKTAMDSFLIGLFVSPRAGGDYTLTIRAHDTVRLASGGLTGALSTPLAHLHGEGDVPKFKQVIFTLFKVTVFAGAMGYGGVMAFNEIFMLQWVGPGIYSGTLVNIMAAWAGIAYSLIVVPYEALFTRAGFSSITRVVWIEVIVRIVVMIALLKTIGVLGTPIAALLCQVFGLLVPLTWINARNLRITRAEMVSLLKSMAMLLAGPIVLAAVFAMMLQKAPVKCSYLVSRGYVNQVLEQLNELQPTSPLQVEHATGSTKILVTAVPVVQERLGACFSAINMAISTADFPFSLKSPTGYRTGVIESIPSPANSWLVLTAEAALFLALCLIYTWWIDKRLVKFMLRGGRGAAA